jgi:FKBP-type peptidyl-prolyl cis-trans isomerase
MKNDGNDDWIKQYEEQERRIDSILTADKTKIQSYVAEHLPDAQEDTVTISFQYLNKPNVKRGFWYKVQQEPTDDSYEYKIGSTSLVYPKVKLNYTAKLLDGTEVESAEGENFDFNQTSAVIKNAWFVSFFPYSIRLNSEDRTVGGLTKDGLKVGSIITVVTPSYFAYGSTAKTTSLGTIPANSPLVYEFEVISIE